MLNKTTAIFLLASLCAPLSQAFTVIATEETKGTIAKVNPETNTIELTSDSDQESVELSNDARFVVKGVKQAGIKDLKEGHEITIKRRLIKDSIRRIEGKVVSINHDTFSARVRDAESNEVVDVYFSKNIKVKGETTQFTDIAAGQHISLRYTNNKTAVAAQ